MNGLQGDQAETEEGHYDSRATITMGCSMDLAPAFHAPLHDT
jgi:hypothetical protein